MDPFAKFNHEAFEFLKKMAVTFPEEIKIRQYKMMFEQIRLYNPKKPVELFMGMMQPYGLQIMTKDEKYFKNDDCVSAAESMSESLGLVDIWDSIPHVTKESIWAYIQQLYVIGMKASGREAELKEILIQMRNINNKNVKQ